MATYAVGDLQGCFRSLQKLLEECGFDPAADRLWFAGDLVNRGPRSLETLRWIHAHRAHCTVVLGNHDILLLLRAEGLKKARRRDTLKPLLAAPDRDVLLAWLRKQPILHREGDYLLVHAGLLPGWTADEAEQRAQAASAVLAGPYGRQLLASLRGTPDSWDPVVGDLATLRETVEVMTRLRMLGPDGAPRFEYDGPPADAPEGLLAWYDAPGRRTSDATVVFGHWAAHGRLLRPRVLALDTGCVWGNRLTAVRLEDRAVFDVPNAD